MIIKRMVTLQAIVVLGLSSVFLLPPAAKTGEAGIRMELPADVGMWISKEGAITDKELQILSKDTKFARRIYTDPFGDEIMVSIVLSGEDMNNSIHRPERCLPAQGWTIEHSDFVNTPLKGGTKAMTATKLEIVREIAASPTQRIALRNIQYYWFIGARDITASHWRRTFIDIEDRVLRGENQRWAYVTVASNVTDNIQRFGRSQADTSKMLEEFMSQLVPMLQKPDGTPAMDIKIASR